MRALEFKLRALIFRAIWKIKKFMLHLPLSRLWVQNPQLGLLKQTEIWKNIYEATSSQQIASLKPPALPSQRNRNIKKYLRGNILSADCEIKPPALPSWTTRNMKKYLRPALPSQTNRNIKKYLRGNILSSDCELKTPALLSQRNRNIKKYFRGKSPWSSW